MISQDEFFTLLNAPTDAHTDVSADNLTCGITHESCVNPITLECGHTFEYTALVAELVNRRTINKAGRFASHADRSIKHGFKCPYCRTLHMKTLPYFRLKGISLSRGINCPAKTQMKYSHTCPVLTKSGTNKGQPCGKVAFFHSKDAVQRYCARHGADVMTEDSKTCCRGVLIRGTVPQGMRQACRATTGINCAESHPTVGLCGTHRRMLAKRGTIYIFKANAAITPDHFVEEMNVESLCNPFISPHP
jgi:hypothetical protein